MPRAVNLGNKDDNSDHNVKRIIRRIIELLSNIRQFFGCAFLLLLFLLMNVTLLFFLLLFRLGMILSNPHILFWFYCFSIFSTLRRFIFSVYCIFALLAFEISLHFLTDDSEPQPHCRASSNAQLLCQYKSLLPNVLPRLRFFYRNSSPTTWTVKDMVTANGIINGWMWYRVSRDE